eukprot:CAMPEP_0170798686 /NCGR_PEP_ID=MMETSP0733-20121128/26517_1 /TAXON_ID=186038 /ORGANISM="Fragilariopsis kerguelensis, Strain L26-C5" /LENGTH=519 /DNA_ID=CAMNT_0011150113 /DNA_START=385 /DNA_END=1944 /DNA_ORIENTATION=+
MNWASETTVIPSSYSSSSIPSISSSSFSSSSSNDDEKLVNHYEILSSINTTGAVVNHSHVQDDDEEENIIDEEDQDYDIIEVVNDDDEDDDDDDDADDDDDDDDNSSVISCESTTSTCISKCNDIGDGKIDDDAGVLGFNTARSVIAMEVAMEATIRRQTSTFDLFRLDLDLHSIQTIGYGPPATSFGKEIRQQGYDNYDHCQDHNYAIQIPSIAEQAAAEGLARLKAKQIKQMTLISNNNEYVEKNESIIEIDSTRKIEDVNHENSSNSGKIYYDKEQLTIEVENFSTATIDNNNDDDSNNATSKSYFDEDNDEDDGSIGENEDGDDDIKTCEIEDIVVLAVIVEDRVDRKNVVEEEQEVEDDDDGKESVGTPTTITYAEKEKCIYTKGEEKELTTSHLLSALSDPFVDSSALIDVYDKYEQQQQGKDKVAIINNDNVNPNRIVGEEQDKDSDEGSQNVSRNNGQMLSNKEVEDGKVAAVAEADSTKPSSVSTRLIDFASLSLFRKPFRKPSLRQWRS